MGKMPDINDKEIAQLVEQQKIKQVLIRYAVAIDTKNWPLLKTCFATDGQVDYGPEAGQHMGTDEIVRIVRQFIENLSATRHLTGNYQIEIKGDGARCVSYLHAQHYLAEAPSGEVYTLGGVYHDTVVKTGDEWKIKHRRLETIWTTGNAEIFEEANARA